MMTTNKTAEEHWVKQWKQDPDEEQDETDELLEQIDQVVTKFACLRNDAMQLVGKMEHDKERIEQPKGDHLAKESVKVYQSRMETKVPADRQQGMVEINNKPSTSEGQVKPYWKQLIEEIETTLDEQKIKVGQMEDRFQSEFEQIRADFVQCRAKIKQLKADLADKEATVAQVNERNTELERDERALEKQCQETENKELADMDITEQQVYEKSVEAIGINRASDMTENEEEQQILRKSEVETEVHDEQVHCGEHKDQEQVLVGDYQGDEKVQQGQTLSAVKRVSRRNN